MQDSQTDDDIAIKALRDQLEQAGISTADWGKGQAKTLRHLVKEIKDGETTLVNDARGQLVRSVVVGNADVYYKLPNGNLLRLKEYRQVFNDGRERRRNLGCAVSEKMKPNETPEEAMIRGIQEELGIAGPIDIAAEGTKEETIDSTSYPGLRSRYIQHKFRIMLNSEQYKLDGYTEEQGEIKTYFIWENFE